MVTRRLIGLLVNLWILWAVPTPAEAYITILKGTAKVQCSMVFSHHVSKERVSMTTRGMTTRWNEKRLSQGERLFSALADEVVRETKEAYGAVYSAFLAAMKKEATRKKWTLDPTAFIRELTIKDEDSTWDRTIVFVSRSSRDDRILAVLKAEIETATLASLKDRHASQNLQPVVHRIRLGRVINISRSPVIARELMQAVAQELRLIFRDRPYEVYSYTDRSRARSYSFFGFRMQYLPHHSEHENYYVSQRGEEFYNRYQGHVFKAFRQAFSWPFDVEGGLKILRDTEQMPGMADYLPNLIAQAVLHAFARNYSGAVDISEYLKTIGSAEINLDYNALWKARVAFDFTNGRGDANAALNLLRRRQKLGGQGEERLRVFTHYKLAVLLRSERFAEARELLNNNVGIEDLPYESSARLAYFWGRFASSTPSLKIRELDPQRVIEAMNLLIDSGTAPDNPYISSILNPLVYEMRAEAFERLQQPEMAAKEWRIYEFLQSQNFSH